MAKGKRKSFRGKFAAFAALAVASLGAAAFGAISTKAPPAKAGPAFKSSFRAPPQEALKALKAAVGKPFDSGWVFIDGKFVSPPYKVERWGNVIRINQIQITGEIVPWSDFVKTQAGAKAVKPETPEAPEPDAGCEEAAQEETPDPVDDGDVTLDDLFSDEPAPKAAKETSRKAPKPSARTKKQGSKTVYTFEGDFVPNAKTAAYVKKINDYRTNIDMHLRSGGYGFFGSRYQPFLGDSRAAQLIVHKLPDVMRSSTEPEKFSSALRSAGIPFMPPSLVNDLFKGRILYPQIQQRLKKQEESLKLPY